MIWRYNKETTSNMVSSLIQRIGTLFYMVDPGSSTFKDAKEVPKYIHEAVPLFVVLMLLEAGIHYLRGQKIRFNELLSCGGLGLLHLATDFIASAMMLFGYEWLYDRRLMDLPWDSLSTWIGAFFLVDFCYYWIHRANHEVNILWAVHQVHHSAEDIHFGVPMRNHILQRVASFGFYQPLALLGFPFPTILTHVALNFLFQFWLHTDIIKSLGPFEYILNTPSHHRVHHGVNKWCLDKNYGSVLIIWDLLFGTFAKERDNEEIIYGLTDQPQSHNVIWHQVYYFRYMYEKVTSMNTWKDKLKTIFFGPGWNPGTSRLGDPDAYPDIKGPRAKYDPQLPYWHLGYLIIHSLIASVAQYIFCMHVQDLSWPTIAVYQLFFFTSVGILSSMLDSWKWAPILEVMRCAAIVAYTHTYPVTVIPFVDTLLTATYTLSTILWISQSIAMDKALISIVELDKFE